MNQGCSTIYSTSFLPFILHGTILRTKGRLQEIVLLDLQDKLASYLNYGLLDNYGRTPAIVIYALHLGTASLSIGEI